MIRKLFIFQLLLLVATIGATAIAYPYLPQRIPAHWDLHGHVNRYGSRMELFTIPVIMAVFMFISVLIAWSQRDDEDFQIDGWVLCRILGSISCFFTYLYAIILAACTGHALDMTRTMMTGLCVFIAYLGNLLGKVRSNCFIGVRTPWTLASERVWYATHRVAAKTYVAGSLLALLLFASIGMHLWLMIAFLIVLVAPAAYSLVYYKHLAHHGEL